MKTILSFLLAMITTLSFSQSTINNLDFEDGNFNNWTIINGTVNAPFPHSAHPFVFSSYGILDSGIYNDASHLIINSQQNDSDVNFIKTLCPFTNSNSVRLGDLNQGAKATRIERVITVDSTNFNLDLFFALVMEDPAHPLHEQPYIFVELYDSSAGSLTLIDSVFIEGGDSRLSSDTGLGNWRYVDWQHQQFNLSSFIGRKVLFRITNGDCGYGAHSGRLYLDISMNLKHQYTSAYLCSPTDSIIFRGNRYDSVGMYRDTVWSGSTIDTVFTLAILGSILSPTSAKLSYNLCKSRYDFDCIINGGSPGIVNYNWIINGLSRQSSQFSKLNTLTSLNDTIYCMVSHIGGNCFLEYSDTLIIGNISVPLVDLIIVGLDLKADMTGGVAPFSYGWSYNTIPILFNNSTITPTAN
jgi:hypothetical protein